MAFQGFAFMVVSIGLASLLYYMFSGSEQQPAQSYNNQNSSSGGGGGGSYSSWDSPRKNEQRQRSRRRRRFSHIRECAICFEEIKSANMITLKCDHTFHRTCIDGWTNCGPVGTQNTCPLCRMEYRNM